MGLPGKVQGGHLSRVPLQFLNPRVLRKFHLPQVPPQIHLLEPQAQGPPPLIALVLLLGQPLGSHSLAWEEEEEGEELPICQRAEGGLRASSQTQDAPT